MVQTCTTVEWSIHINILISNLNNGLRKVRHSKGSVIQSSGILILALFGSWLLFLRVGIYILVVNCSGDLKWVGLKMVHIPKGIWNLKARAFEIWTNGSLFVKYHLKSRQKCLDLEWSCFWMVGTVAISLAKAQPFKRRTIWNTTFKIPDS